MSKSKSKPTTETPLCIRFRPGYLDRVRRCAARSSMLQSEWIREAVFERVEQVLDKMPIEPLSYQTAGGEGDQICIRFRLADFDRIIRAAKEEGGQGQLPSPWIRAVVVRKVEASESEVVSASPISEKSSERSKTSSSDTNTDSKKKRRVASA